MYCVLVGRQEYCGVTTGWTPRIDDTLGALAVLLPLLFCGAILLTQVKYKRCRLSIKVQKIRDTFHSIRRAIYYSTIQGEGRRSLAELLALPKPARDQAVWADNLKHRRVHRDTDIEEMDQEARRRLLQDRGYSAGSTCSMTKKEEVKVLRAGGVGMNVCPGAIKKYYHLKWTKVRVPNWIRLCLMTGVVIGAPLVKIIWDLVDVGVDCFYAKNLELGHFIDGNITRHHVVISTVYSFALIGALKWPIYAWINLRVIDIAYGMRPDYESRCELLKKIAVVMKIALEDAVELFVEYFYVDKYVVKNPVYLMIFKDIVTAIIYLLPLIYTAFKLSKRYELIHQYQGICIARYIYLPCTILQLLFSLLMITKVCGMSYQYMRGDIGHQCLEVRGSGQLVQRPFRFQCLNLADWTILGLLSICSVFVVFIFISLIIFRNDFKLKSRYTNIQIENIDDIEKIEVVEEQT